MDPLRRGHALPSLGASKLAFPLPLFSFQPPELEIEAFGTAELRDNRRGRGLGKAEHRTTRSMAIGAAF